MANEVATNQNLKKTKQVVSVTIVYHFLCLIKSCIRPELTFLQPRLP